MTVTDALVIRGRDIDEQDRLLTLLTSDMGVVTAYAKGAKKLRGSMTSATELLCYSRFTLAQKGDSRFIDAAESEHIFFGLRQDVSRLSLATYFCQLCAELIPEDDRGDDGALRLMLNTLYLLEKDAMSRPLLKAVLELRLLTLAGYMPDLSGCRECGRAQGLLFSPAQGVCYCADCGKETPGLLTLSPGVLDAMRHITACPPERLFRFRLSAGSEKALSTVSERYLLCQVERMVPALEFYKKFGKT